MQGEFYAPGRIVAGGEESTMNARIVRGDKRECSQGAIKIHNIDDQGNEILEFSSLTHYSLL